MAIYLGENKVDGGGSSGTSTPTIDEVAEFDTNAKMNSTDMTSQELSTFINGLNINGNTNIATMETLDTNARLIRFFNVRVLQLVEFQGANSTLAIPADDRPSNTVNAPIHRADSNGRSCCSGYMSISPTTGYVQRYYVGTYNASGSGISNVNATDKVSGIVIWIV